MEQPRTNGIASCTRYTHSASSITCTPPARSSTSGRDSGWDCGVTMLLTLRDDLLLVPVTMAYRGRQVQIPDLVVDTGSATTLISTDCGCTGWHRPGA